MEGISLIIIFDVHVQWDLVMKPNKEEASLLPTNSHSTRPCLHLISVAVEYRKE